MAKVFSTLEAAAKIGVTRQTLYSWIAAGVIEAPKPIRAGVRLWTQNDIDRAAKAKGTLRPGPKRKKRKAGAR